MLAEAETEPERAAARTALESLHLRDEPGTTWSYTGQAWWQHNGSEWVEGKPGGALTIVPTTFAEVEIAPSYHRCGSELPEGVRFCLECGAPQAVEAEEVVEPEWPCPSCPAVNPAGTKFCIGCGLERREPAATAASAGWPCPGCGEQQSAGRAFCTACGSARGGGSG